jgi:excisionase family DNA binding protein
MHQVFTTGQVAKLCNVSARTVCNWANSGRLKAYRLPSSAQRRIEREHLIQFMKDNGLPLGTLADAVESLRVRLLHAIRDADDFRLAATAAFLGMNGD